MMQKASKDFRKGLVNYRDTKFEPIYSNKEKASKDTGKSKLSGKK